MKKIETFTPNFTLKTISVGLDISLNSTACIISTVDEFGVRDNLKVLAFCSEKSITNKIVNETESSRGTTSDMIIGCVDYHYIEHTTLPKNASYSQVEYTHVRDYDRISYEITSVISSVIDTLPSDYTVQFNIEGYSQGLTPGKIIELVSFSYAIRNRLIQKYEHGIFNFVPPSTLKKYACYFTYGYTHKTKKPSDNPSNWITRAPYGIAGGSFKKPDMLKSLLASSMDDAFVRMCKAYPEWLERASIPKPIDDLVDAYWLSMYV